MTNFIEAYYHSKNLNPPNFLTTQVVVVNHFSQTLEHVQHTNYEIMKCLILLNKYAAALFTITNSCKTFRKWFKAEGAVA